MTTARKTASNSAPTEKPKPPIRKDAAYWARVQAIAEAAPPLTTEQRALLRVLFHESRTTTRTEPMP